MTCDIWTMPPSRCGGVERVLRSTSDSVRGLPSAAIICHHLTVPTQLRWGGKQDYVPCPRPYTGHYSDTGPLLLQWLSRGTCWLCWLLGRIRLVDAGLVSNYLLFQIIFTAGCSAHYVTAKRVICGPDAGRRGRVKGRGNHGLQARTIAK